MQRPLDAALRREYVSAMHGKHQLEWSPGLKKPFGIGDKTDPQIIEKSEAPETDIATLLAKEWRDVPAVARVLLLEAAEGRGQAGVNAALIELHVRKAVPEFWEYEAGTDVWEEVPRGSRHERERAASL